MDERLSDVQGGCGDCEIIGFICQLCVFSFTLHKGELDTLETLVCLGSVCCVREAQGTYIVGCFGLQYFPVHVFER